MLIRNYYSRDVHLTFWDIYPWVISFPECVAVFLFSFRIPLGTRWIWKLFLIPYFVFVVVFVWQVLEAYIFFSPMGIAYKLPAAILLAVKGFDVCAVVTYSREDAIWRKSY